ncbi:MAG: thermonuclease family protein, partial [Actinobacteria bacterium]|nr:thermonuclease family protein [Actinomycetota bacterium]
MRILIAGVVVLVMLFGVGCGGESSEKDASVETSQETKQRNAVTVEETTAPRETTELTTGFEFSVGRSPMDEDEYDATVKVTRVVDGDTVDITPAVDGVTRVRLIGVDTPETRDPDCGVQPYGNEAKAFTTSELQ